MKKHYCIIFMMLIAWQDIFTSLSASVFFVKTAPRHSTGHIHQLNLWELFNDPVPYFVPKTCQPQKAPWKHTPLMGAGTYGSVISITSRSKQKYALKRTHLKNKNERNVVYSWAEALYLKALDHPGIIKSAGSYFPETLDEYNFPILYTATELLDSDLHKVIYSKNEMTQLHYKSIFHQLFEILYYLNTAGIIHRDLKPSNILVSLSNSRIKLADFGMATLVNSNETENFTVGTIWYLAPEILIGKKRGTPGKSKYGTKSDMWSAGIILLEAVLRWEPFVSHKKSELRHEINALLSNLSETKEGSVGHLINQRIGPNGLDLLRALLKVDPEDRLSPREALEHPYLKEYHPTYFDFSRHSYAGDSVRARFPILWDMASIQLEDVEISETNFNSWMNAISQNCALAPDLLPPLRTRKAPPSLEPPP